MNAQMEGLKHVSCNYLHTQKGKSKNLRPRIDGGGGMVRLAYKIVTPPPCLRHKLQRH